MINYFDLNLHLDGTITLAIVCEYIQMLVFQQKHILSFNFEY